MFLWVKAVALYLVSAAIAFLLSVVVAFCAVRLWAGPNDDSPALGIMMFILVVGIFGLFLPLFLGLSGELLEAKVLARRFNFLRCLRRVLLAFPIGAGPFYAWWVLLALRQDARPVHWLAKLVLLLFISAVFGYLALRIRRELTQPSAVVSHS